MEKKDKKTNLICPIENTIQFLGERWTMIILRYIFINKIVRFSQIQKEFPSISSKTLSKRLKELEERKFIRKEKFKETPPRIEYSNTIKGEEFGRYLDKFNKIILRFEKEEKIEIEK